MHRVRWSTAAYGIVNLMTALNVWAAEGPALPALLKAVHLSGYPSVMQPPAFSGDTIDGRQITLADLSGRVVLINFWATWCLECRSEMPAFERLHRELSVQGLAIVGINAREALSTIRDYARELRLTLPLIADPTGKINSAYGVIGLPTTFLIARDGHAVGLATGPREWSAPAARALMQALLGERRAVKEK